jgi:hypothetical protein
MTEDDFVSVTLASQINMATRILTDLSRDLLPRWFSGSNWFTGTRKRVYTMLKTDVNRIRRYILKQGATEKECAALLTYAALMLMREAKEYSSEVANQVWDKTTNESS